jgi:AcrR family transcriptional regulator
MPGKTSDLPRDQLRGPVQARSLKRVEASCAAAERLLVELGPDQTSIPEIAALAQVPRATIYQYFPDKYALFAHLAEAQFKRVTDQVDRVLVQAGDMEWRDLTRIAVDAAAEFYNDHKVAAILLLLGPFGSADRAAHVEKDRVLAERFRVRLGLDRDQGRAACEPGPDRIALAIQIAFACFRYGYIREGRISPTICGEAVWAATAYLEPLLASKPA